MKHLPLLLLLAMPLHAAAQGRPRPGEASALSVRMNRSDRRGLERDTLGATGNFGMGRLGGYALSASAEYSRHDLSADGWLPGRLYNTGLKFTAAGQKWFFSGGLRSNSDRPYASSEEIDLFADATTTLRRSGPHSVVFGFNYSSRRSFFRGMPLPYVTYRYATETLDIFLPFSLKWKISESSDFSAAYIPPRYFDLAASRKISRVLKLRLEGGVSMSQYLIAGRADEDQLLFIEQPSAALTAEISAAGNITVRVSAGYGFKGRYFSGRKYDEHRNKVNFGGGPSYGVSLQRSF